MKVYTASQKEEACKMAINSEKSTAAVAKTLGIPVGTMYVWVSKYKKDHPDLVKNKETDEVKLLQKELAELKMENEFLKKATAFFAKNQPA